MARKVNARKKLSGGMERRLVQIERADEVLGLFNAELLLGLQKRREASAQADGHKSGHQGSGGGEMTSTEAAATRGLPDADSDEHDDWRTHVRPDFIGESVEEIITLVDSATFSLRKAGKLLNPVINAADSLKERKRSVGECRACHRDVLGPPETTDRLKSGYCEYSTDPEVIWSGCFERWRRAGYPDRPRFEAYVRRQIAQMSKEADVPA